MATDVFNDESGQYEFRDIEPHAIDAGIDTNMLDYEAMEFLSDEKYNLPTIHEQFVAPQIDAPSDEQFEHGNTEVCAPNAVTSVDTSDFSHTQMQEIANIASKIAQACVASACSAATITAT